MELTVDAYVPNTLHIVGLSDFRANIALLMQPYAQSGGFDPDPDPADLGAPQEDNNFDPRKSVLVIRQVQAFVVCLGFLVL